jgi:nicotinamidase/pyrazinamidase
MKRIDFLGIDWQYDFVNKKGSLSVPGADEDAKRVANLINRIGKKFTNMYFSLDSHQYNQVFFPTFFLDKNNQHPNPFTPISHQEIVDEVYRATKRSMQDWALEYTKQLEDKGRYTLFLWPFHTIVGTEGWSLDVNIANAIKKWEVDNFRRVNFIVKGNNPYVENYSVFQAEVIRPDDPNTQLNSQIVNAIQEADEIVLTGEALSHCVAWSVTDLANNFSSDEYIKKLVFLTDASSSVPGFEQQGEDFVKEMTKRGMRTSTTIDYLS